jgi:hypothetical protein
MSAIATARPDVLGGVTLAIGVNAALAAVTAAAVRAGLR